MMPSFASCLTLALAAACVPAAAWSSPLSITLAPESVRVDGLAPGGRAVVLGVSRVGVEALVRTERLEAVASDSDGNGSVSVELPGALSDRSAWVAVDLASGDWVAAHPEDYPQVTLPIAEGALEAAGFDQPGSLLELLWVRPGAGESSGAWGGTAGDGGSADADGLADGTVRVTPSAFGPVEGSPPVPSSLAPGDLIVVVSPDTLGAGVVRVSGSGEAGEGVGR